MGKLIYSAIMSLDGFVANREGNFDWGEPDEEVHGYVNDLQRPIGTHLYGRRLYEVMVAWETIDDERRSSGISRRSGVPPTRSCIRGR